MPQDKCLLVTEEQFCDAGTHVFSWHKTQSSCGTRINVFLLNKTQYRFPTQSHLALACLGGALRRSDARLKHLAWRGEGVPESTQETLHDPVKQQPLGACWTGRAALFWYLSSELEAFTCVCLVYITRKQISGGLWYSRPPMVQMKAAGHLAVLFHMVVAAQAETALCNHVYTYVLSSLCMRPLLLLALGLCGWRDTTVRVKHASPITNRRHVATSSLYLLYKFNSRVMPICGTYADLIEGCAIHHLAFESSRCLLRLPRWLHRVCCSPIQGRLRIPYGQNCKSSQCRQAKPPWGWAFKLTCATLSCSSCLNQSKINPTQHNTTQVESTQFKSNRLQHKSSN